jgi:flagellar basal body-associated protein FliL
MEVEDRAPDDNPDRGLDRVTSLGVLIGVISAVVAGATIWLVITDPVTVASAIEGGEVSPLVRRLAEVLYNALAGLLAYL